VVSFTADGRVTSNGIAKRLRQTGAGAPSSRYKVMEVVLCGQCGDRFAITHETASADPDLATRQAVWLQDHFVWDHIQETKHRSSITLPAAEELGESRGQVAAPRH
jgi:hypothetical protein